MGWNIFFFFFVNIVRVAGLIQKKKPIEWMHWIESVYITVFVNQSKPEKRGIFFSYNIHRKKLDDDDDCLGLASLILFRKQYGSTIYTLYCHRCYDVFLFIHHLGFILFVWKQRTKRKRVGYIFCEYRSKKKTNSLQWFNVFEFLNPKEVQRSICWTNKQNKIKKHQTNWTLYLQFLPKDSLFLFLYYPSIFIHYYDNDNGHPIGWTFKYDNDNNNMKYMHINGNVWTKKTKLPCTYLINARKKIVS